MKKLVTACLLSLATLLGFSQNPDFSKIKFWTGNGSKVAMLVIDFNDGSTNESFAWGYRFDGDNVTAQTMLNDIVDNDTNLSIALNGGFLSDIHYLTHSCIGGSPYYWSTFNFINNIWEMNMGYSEILSDSMIFGNSYTDFDEFYNPITLPETPIPAPKPFMLHSENIINWTGSGSNTAFLIVDFNDQTNSECFAWGYRFDEDSVTSEQMIQDIISSDYHLTVNISSGFLNDIHYFSHSGIGGNPNYWASFTLSNFIWNANLGISETIHNNTIFGLSYTDWDEYFNPIDEPEEASPAPIHTKVNELTSNEFSVYPNPSTNYINICTNDEISKISIFDLSGKLIFDINHKLFQNNQLDISMLSKGTYVLQIENSRTRKHQLFIKK